jgi:uncharacterized protein (DUF111 family)
MNKFYEIGFLNNDVPVVSRNVYHSSEQLKHEICVLATLLDHHGVILEMLLKSVLAVWVKLSDISNTFEKKGIPEFTSSSNQII